MLWVAIILCFAIFLSLIYRRQSGHHRRMIRRGFAVLLIADELWKYIIVLRNGIDVLYYLPLHLCYISILIVIVHALVYHQASEHEFRSKVQDYMGNFLYLIGIPAGLSAILFPAWTELPAFANAMSFHSFSSHVLFVSYIVMMIAGGEIRLNIRTIPVLVGALFLMAALVYSFNLHFDTNYMYIMRISSGSPLKPFEALGDYRYGYAIILAGLILLLYGIPMGSRSLLLRKKNKA